LRRASDAGDAALPVEPLTPAPEPALEALSSATVDDGAEPPFDPPDADDILGSRGFQDDAPTRRAPAPQDELLLIPGQVDRRGQYQPPPNSALKPKAADAQLNEAPVPPIKVLAAWDRPNVQEMLAHFAADSHLARADIVIDRPDVYFLCRKTTDTQYGWACY
jgi:hypothetical protein